MHNIFYYSGIVLWIGIIIVIAIWLFLFGVACTIPNEVDDNC